MSIHTRGNDVPDIPRPSYDPTDYGLDAPIGPAAALTADYTWAMAQPEYDMIVKEGQDLEPDDYRIFAQIDNMYAGNMPLQLKIARYVGDLADSLANPTAALDYTDEDRRFVERFYGLAPLPDNLAQRAKVLLEARDQRRYLLLIANLANNEGLTLAEAQMRTADIAANVRPPAAIANSGLALQLRARYLNQRNRNT